MAKYSETKYKRFATDEQIDDLKKSLQVGSPLTVALSYAGIPSSVFYYWVHIASIVIYVKEMGDIKDNSEVIKSGVSLVVVQNQSLELNLPKNKKNSSSIYTFVEPTPESIQRYKNVAKFQAYCDDIYKLVKELDKCRSEIVMYHLAKIRESAGKPKANTQSSQWFLERTMPDYFGRDRNDNTDNENNSIPPIKVEYIDPNTKEAQTRIKDMEQLIDDEMNPIHKGVN